MRLQGDCRGKGLTQRVQGSHMPTSFSHSCPPDLFRLDPSSTDIFKQRRHQSMRRLSHISHPCPLSSQLPCLLEPSVWLAARLLSLCCGLSSKTWHSFSSSGSQSSLKTGECIGSLPQTEEHRAFHNYVHAMWVPQTLHVKPILRAQVRAWIWRTVGNRQVPPLHPPWWIFYTKMQASTAAMCSSASICPIGTPFEL